jgi:hypothetical protein
MAFSINDIVSQMQYGGARPALFQATITNPVNATGDLKAPFMIRATQLPEFTVGVINVPYFGREIKLAGGRKFGEWNVTVFNDEDYLVRNSMENWSNAINLLENNITSLGTSAPLEYKSQALVNHFGKDGQILRTYQFNGIWPSAVSAMDLDWQNADAIQEFQVTFQYDSFAVVGGKTGNAGGV